MLSAKEKRFIKYWEEQRKGGRWLYYLLYIPAGTIITTILISFLVMMWLIGGIEYFASIAIGSFVLVTIMTLVAWQQNEKKFKGIIRREVNEARRGDHPPTS